MKVKVLNDGGFYGLENVTFPIETTRARRCPTNPEVVEVEIAVFLEAGANPPAFGDMNHLSFLLNFGEVEVLEED